MPGKENYIQASTLDDLIRLALTEVERSGEQINPSKGEARELIGVTLKLENPRARISRTETRGKLFSALGELCWYLSGSNDASFIQYYIPVYAKSAENGIIHGGYGPRLKGQLENITALLKKRPDSRRAVIQLFDSADISKKHKDVPCTCTLQFLLRSGRLHLIAYLRSSDLYLGLPHDVFCFTMVQELVASSVGAELGSYTHIAGSLHLYETNVKLADSFLQEGWQSTSTGMPEMPGESIEESVQTLLAVEEALRLGRALEEGSLDRVHSYWSDLVGILQIFKLCKNGRHEEAKQHAGRIQSTFYHLLLETYIEKMNCSPGPRGDK